MEFKVIDISGKEQGTVTAADNVFGAKVNQTLLSHYLKVFLANARQGTSSTKTRGEVSGGGRKPIRQKGTGRARVGSSRSPIWTGGGITHGPKPKNWSLSFPKKMKQLALVSALSHKAQNDKVTVFEALNLETPNTKEIAATINGVTQGANRILVITADNNLNVRKSVENLPKVEVAMVQNVNTYSVLKASNVIFEKGAVEYLNGKYN